MDFLQLIMLFKTSGNNYFMALNGEKYRTFLCLGIKNDVFILLF